MTVATLTRKARDIVASFGKRSPGRPQELQNPVRKIELVTAARHLTPEEIMAEVAAERSDPRHREEIEYYRAKSTQHLGGQP